MATATHELRQGHRPAGTDAADDVPARARLRGVRRRAVRRGRRRGPDRDRRGRAAARCSCSPRTRSRWRTLGAKEVTPAEEPELHAIIERLCVQADLPKPRVGVIETPMPNAFAMGRSQKSATVCATRGILDLLDTGRARGRDGARAHPRDQPRRDGDDAGELLRHAGRADHPLRVLLRRRLRRRQRARRGGGHR